MAKRVLVIARRFWPTTDDAALRLLHWVGDLQTAGAQVSVLTSRSNPSWPSKIYCGESPVIRLEASASNLLQRGRYCRQLLDWVARDALNFDLLYFDECDLEVVTVLEQLPPAKRPPIVVRFDHGYLSREEGEHWRPSPRLLEVCRKSSAIIANSAAAQQCLISAGVHNTRILRMADDSGVNYDRSIGARRTAREVLGNVNHDLFTKSTDRVVVCPGELTTAWAIDFVISELGQLVEHCRGLHLWLLGDGPERGKLYDSLQHRGLHHCIRMPGVFTDLENVFQAADLCLFPAAGLGMSWLAPTCVASNIPMLMLNTSESRSRFQGPESINLFDRTPPNNLRSKVEHWIHDATPFLKSALQLQRIALEQRGKSSALDRFLALSDCSISCG